MKKFILSILILLIAVPGVAQYGQLGGGITGLTFDGTNIVAGAPADSFIFEIPISAEASITITTLIGTSFKIFNTTGDSMIFNPDGFSSANSAVAGTAVFNYKSRGGHLVIIDSLSAYISVYDSPVSNVGLFQLGTSADADRFKVDEDGDVTNDGTTNSAGGFTDGTFTVDGSGNFTGVAAFTSTGAFTSPGIDDNADAIAITIDVTTEKVNFAADADVVANLTAGTVTSDAGVIGTILSAIGGQDADATLILDADAGDDNTDTWKIISQATGNDLSIMNHETEVFNLTTAGNLQVDGSVTAPGLITTSAATGQGFVVNATGGKSAALLAGGFAGLFMFDDSGIFTIAAQPSANVIAGMNDGTSNLLNISANGRMLLGNNISTSVAGTTLQLKDAIAYLTLQNTTAENGEGGAETRIIFEDHANAALAQIEGSHSGTSDDTKGKLILSTHTGSGLTTALTIDDTQDAIFAFTGSFESTLTINPTVADTEDPSLILKTDADNDGTAFTSEALTINYAAVSDPTLGLWTATTTQSAGFDFDMPLIASTLTSDAEISATGELRILGEATSLYLDYGSAGAEDHDVSIYFGDDGNNTAHSLKWDDGSSRFVLSAALFLDNSTYLITRGVQTRSLGSSGLEFLHSATAGSGDIFTLNHSAVANETNGRQALVNITGTLQQSSTAAYDAMYVNLAVNSTGDGSTGDGNNLLNLSVAGSPKLRVTTGGAVIYTPNALSNAGTSVADDAAITVINYIMRMVGADADALLDTDPAINDGLADGQIVIIQGTADGNTVTIADNVNTQLAGGLSMTLGDGDVLCLMFDSNYSMWIEQYRSDN